MNKIRRFFELKEQWKQSSEADRVIIDQQMTALLDSMTDQEIDLLSIGVQEDFDKIHQEVSDIENQLSLRERLEPVLPFLSVSKLSKDYFHKSSSWFYQRLNGNRIHGKVCQFTDEELKILDMALKDIGKRISSLNIV